ncbi:WD40-repeat-containing domain protein [Fusarium acuminatum]|uniref:WD40-repeat-containing domain protein n=1 Tax=Fusarium acuminatum TaxID=5515 RepID=A0ABZ2WPH3_9HYPO
MLQRPPRRPQSFRRKCSVDLRTPSPLDSGYFSTDDTCGCPQNHRKRCFPSFDGSSLDEFPASKFLENELQISTPIVKREEDSLGLPKTPETRRLRERAEVVSPFIYSRSSGRLPLKDKRVDTNRRKLDRYVPRRMALGQLPQNRGGDRQVSLGAMWSVGGVAPSTIAVDDGQGHLVRRGTNARVFPTPFQESLVSTSVEKEKHEGRIASALEIDQIRRVLDFVQGQRIPQSPRHHTLHTNFSQTSWNGYQWVNKEEWSRGKAVLGIGHSDGIVLFQSLFDTLPRFEVRQTFPISCVSWRPICTLRPSKDPLNPGVEVQTEDLVVGDEMGNIYYYVVEWPLGWEVARDTWPGAVSLIAKISNIHFQQVCGLAWSNDGRMFASGGNDNLCCLFDADQVVGRRPDLPRTGNGYIARIEAGSAYGGIEISVTKLLSLAASDDGPVRSFTAQLRPLPTATDTVRYLGPGVERHRWNHGAAVKAIAFCPWRRELVATGGGSNDKCIHFFHTPSGAALATISVSAQVTSLIWNTTRREIAATFGYASPEHPYRVSVFSWPECKQVAAIP